MAGMEIYNLLVIEDDLSEQKLIKMMVNNSGYPVIMKFINDGEEAVDFVNSYTDQQELFENIQLILLDLNLPKINGIEVLKAIKLHNLLRKTPVVVLTTSNNKNDIIRAYEAGASGFLRKPSTFEEYEKSLKIVLQYWFDICLLV